MFSALPTEMITCRHQVQAFFFLCYSEVTVMMCVIYLPHCEFMGLGCGG